MKKNPVLTVVMDGIGVRSEAFGNAVSLAYTPALHFLQNKGLYTTLMAHGRYVGLPADSDMGNSEVGHNILGSGQVVEQGASLVLNALKDGSLFRGKVWCEALARCHAKGTLHFIGLLSDGNVHSHESHLHAMIAEAAKSGVKKLRVHVLFDGRDVNEPSAESYVAKLEAVLSVARSQGCDARIASGGGRMLLTMDRYEADWTMVERGWRTHVEGKCDSSDPRGAQAFPSMETVFNTLRPQSPQSDQHFPAFVITENHKPVGPIIDGDAVIFFNFRGDRAIELCRAFEEAPEVFPYFARGHVPHVYFAGMMLYDGDNAIPKNFLVAPPEIKNCLGEHLLNLGLRQFACSETQKYGHVTYFWNGNRSGYLDAKNEEYLEIPSDLGGFDERPWMKAEEITRETLRRMEAGSFDFARINYANGDMVGHTGNLQAAIQAVNTVDLMLQRLIKMADKTGCRLIVTADHGNCEQMYQDGVKESSFPAWRDFPSAPPPKTSHTLSQVPCYIYLPAQSPQGFALRQQSIASIGCLANTALQLLGYAEEKTYLPGLLQKK